MRQCFDCGELENLHVHHIQRTLTLKKINTPSNLVDLCERCHFKRHFKDASRSHARKKSIIKLVRGVKNVSED